MKRALILYASRNGATKRAAETIARALAPDCDLYDLRRAALYTPDGAKSRKLFLSLDLAGYGAVALGSGIYMGKPLPAFRRFCEKRQFDLAKLPLLFFTCGIALAEEEREFLGSVLPEPLKGFVGGLHHLGGELSESRGFLHRMVMEEYVKKFGVKPALNEGAIAGLAAAIRALL